MRQRILLLLSIVFSIVSVDLMAQKVRDVENNNEVLKQIRQYWSISDVTRYAGGFMNIENEIFDLREVEFYDENEDGDKGKLRLERQEDKLLITASDFDIHFEVIELSPELLVLDMYFNIDKEVKQLARFSMKPRENK